MRILRFDFDMRLNEDLQGPLTLRRALAIANRRAQYGRESAHVLLLRADGSSWYSLMAPATFTLCLDLTARPATWSVRYALPHPGAGYYRRQGDLDLFA